MVQHKDFSLKLPAALRVHGGMHHHHALPDLITTNLEEHNNNYDCAHSIIITHFLESKGRCLPATDLLHRQSLAMDSSDDNRYELTQ